jgi:hypothetical protein
MQAHAQFRVCLRNRHGSGYGFAVDHQAGAGQHAVKVCLPDGFIDRFVQAEVVGVKDDFTTQVLAFYQVSQEVGGMPAGANGKMGGGPCRRSGKVFSLSIYYGNGKFTTPDLFFSLRGSAEMIHGLMRELFVELKVVRDHSAQIMFSSDLQAVR